MGRLARIVLLALVVVLAGLVAQPAWAAPPLPSSMAAIGDSITRAYDVCCSYGDHPGQSWSTGSTSYDGIASHYERIRAQNPAIRGHRWNNAVSGAKMADAPAQARRTVGQGAQYVTILMGANDLCGWDGTLTPTATFRAQFAETLDILRTGLPASHVFVASIPNLYQLWSILRVNPVAQAVWHTAGICPSMLNLFNSPADRQAVIDREHELNAALRDVCASWSNCRFDNYLTYNYNFTPAKHRQAHPCARERQHPTAGARRPAGCRRGGPANGGRRAGLPAGAAPASRRGGPRGRGGPGGRGRA
jgi:lysophospholipase L1-like esterase